jgi:hypothetical protein
MGESVSIKYQNEKNKLLLYREAADKFMYLHLCKHKLNL